MMKYMIIKKATHEVVRNGYNFRQVHAFLESVSDPDAYSVENDATNGQ